MLPVSAAAKILPFRPPSSKVEGTHSVTPDLTCLAADAAEIRVAEAWRRLAMSERGGQPRQVLRNLEAAYMQTVEALRAIWDDSCTAQNNVGPELECRTRRLTLFGAYTSTTLATARSTSL